MSDLLMAKHRVGFFNQAERRRLINSVRPIFMTQGLPC